MQQQTQLAKIGARAQDASAEAMTDPVPGRGAAPPPGVTAVPGRATVAPASGPELADRDPARADAETAAWSAVHGACATPGVPLPDVLRHPFAGALGMNLDDVSLHAGEASARAAEALGARAFAVGRQVHFASGQLDLASPDGQRLLAHEIAHVAQQGGRAAAPQLKLLVGAADDPAEAEADRAAEAMLRGQRATVSSGHAPALRRTISVGGKPIEPAAPRKPTAGEARLAVLAHDQQHNYDFATDEALATYIDVVNRGQHDGTLYTRTQGTAPSQDHRPGAPGPRATRRPAPQGVQTPRHEPRSQAPAPAPPRGELDTILDRMEVPHALRCRERYLEAAREVQRLWERASRLWTRPEVDRFATNPAQPQQLFTSPDGFYKAFASAYHELPATGDLTEWLVEYHDTGGGVLDETEHRHLGSSLTEYEENDNAPSASAAISDLGGGVSHGGPPHPVGRCECKACYGPAGAMSPDLKKFVAEVFRSAETREVPGARAMTQGIYDAIYTHVPPLTDRLSNEDTAYVGSLHDLDRKFSSASSASTASAKAHDWNEFGSPSVDGIRIYIHPTRDAALTIMEAVLSLIKGEYNGRVTYAKIAHPQWAGVRPDTIVATAVDEEAARAFVTALKGRFKQADWKRAIDPSLPQLTEQVIPGVALARDPQTRTEAAFGKQHSFGESRSRIVAEALHDLMMCPGEHELADFERAVVCFFRWYGLDPQAPQRDTDDSYRPLFENASAAVPPPASPALAEADATPQASPQPSRARSPRRPFPSPADAGASPQPSRAPSPRRPFPNVSPVVNKAPSLMPKTTASTRPPGAPATQHAAPRPPGVRFGVPIPFMAPSPVGAPSPIAAPSPTGAPSSHGTAPAGGAAKKEKLRKKLAKLINK
jgi:hypothetical protein